VENKTIFILVLTFLIFNQSFFGAMQDPLLSWYFQGPEKAQTLTKSTVRDSLPCKSIVIAIPKSGSNLLTKCVGIILNRVMDEIIFGRNLPFPQSVYELSSKDLYGIIEETKRVVWHTHLMYKPEHARAFVETGSSIFFGYRDPRDLVVSFARFMQRFPEIWRGADKVPLNDLIMDLILSNNLFPNNPPAKSILDLYSKYLPWINVSGCYSVRFENLVGARGGGSDKVQIQEIKNIAEHVGVILTDARAKDIARKLFGGTWTFQASQDMAGKDNAGKIGSWKYCFTQEHKRAFKEVAGQLLIDLRYEKDFNW